MIPKVAGETICALSAWVVKYTHIYNGHLLSKKTYTGKCREEKREERERARERERKRERKRKRARERERESAKREKSKKARMSTRGS